MFGSPTQRTVWNSAVRRPGAVITREATVRVCSAPRSAPFLRSESADVGMSVARPVVGLPPGRACAHSDHMAFRRKQG